MVKLRRGTETGDAPGWQRATHTELQNAMVVAIVVRVAEGPTMCEPPVKKAGPGCRPDVADEVAR